MRCLMLDDVCSGQVNWRETRSGELRLASEGAQTFFVHVSTETSRSSPLRYFLLSPRSTTHHDHPQTARREDDADGHIPARQLLSSLKESRRDLCLLLLFAIDVSHRQGAVSS